METQIAQRYESMTGGEAVIASLVAYGIDTIFGMPGVHTLPIYDAIARNAAMRHVLARHEQGAGFMAEGYARASGKIGVACTITGPGVTNIVTPMASAHADSIPLFVVSSAVRTATTGRLRGELHELKNQQDMMKAVAGWTGAVNSVEQIPTAIKNAILTLTTTRPRGAYLEIPHDLLKDHADVSIPLLPPVMAISPVPASIQHAAGMLRAAQRPIIIAGAGVTAAGANIALMELAERLDAPVVLGPKSHDAAPSNHRLVIPTSFSLPQELLDLAGCSDVALVVGSKLGAERTDYGDLRLPKRLIHVDIDPEEIGRDYPAEVAIVADAALTIRALLDELYDHKPVPVPLRDATSVRNATSARDGVIFHTRNRFGSNVAFLDDINDINAELPVGAILVADMTMLGYAAAAILKSNEPRTFLHSVEFCAIGCGLPTAIGAKVARPDRSILALCGDGGFLLNLAELATAIQEGIHIVVVVFNDHAFTAVREVQRRQYDGRVIATDLDGPDYVALARSFGADGVHVSTHEAFRDALKLALADAHLKTTLIEVALEVSLGSLPEAD